MSGFLVRLDGIEEAGGDRALAVEQWERPPEEWERFRPIFNKPHSLFGRAFVSEVNQETKTITISSRWPTAEEVIEGLRREINRPPEKLGPLLVSPAQFAMLRRLGITADSE